MSSYVRLLRYLKPYRWQVIAGLLCLTVGTPLSLVHPWIWKFIVDEVVLKRHLASLGPALALMIAAHFSGALLNAVRSNLLEKAGQSFVRDLRNEIYQRLQAQSLEYLQEHRSGDLIARAIGDVDVLQEVVLNGTDAILSNVYSFVLVAGSLIYLSPLLGGITIAPIVVVYLLVRMFNVRVKRLYRGARDRLGDVSARLQENLIGIMVVKAFAKEAFEAERFRETTEEYRRVQFQAVNARSLFFPISQFVGFISNVLAVGVGAWLILQGRFTVGGLVAYRGYWWQLFAPVQQLAQINDLIQRGNAAASRVFELLDEPTSAVEPESEWIIQQALERLMRNRTTCIVSHRLSVVRGADRIVVLDQGRIEEQGTHDQLLARGGLYAEMHRMQMGHPRESLAAIPA